jgi:hypothetical protein
LRKFEKNLFLISQYFLWFGNVTVTVGWASESMDAWKLMEAHGRSRSWTFSDDRGCLRMLAQFCCATLTRWSWWQFQIIKNTVISPVKNSLCFSFKFLIIFLQISRCLNQISFVFARFRIKVPEILRGIKTLWHEILNDFCGLLSDFLYLNKLFRVISQTFEMCWFLRKNIAKKVISTKDLLYPWGS